MMTNTTLNDNEMAAAVLSQSNPKLDEYLIVANLYTIALYTRSIGGAWSLVGHGELGNETIDEISKKRGGRNLFLIETKETNPLSVDVTIETSKQTTKSALKTWLKTSNALCAGRGAEPNNKVKHEVGCAAGWHCQFEGCGENLYTHTKPGISGNFSYFAHIIASSSDGPRGDPAQSPLRATDPTNLMLLCDKCHRLIDRVAPQTYPADLLFEMRKNNIRQVSGLLAKLKYKGAQMVAVTQPIKGQGSGFDERLAEEAMWRAKLRKSNRDCLHFMQVGNLSSSNQTAYWLSYFHTLKADLSTFKRRIDGTDGNTGRPDHIALFPLHSTSVLVITGRILGEASTVSLFQFHRDVVGGSEGGQWAWPDNAKPEDSKFIFNVHKEHESNESEALLLVNVTARIPVNELPAQFQSNGQLQLPTIEITVDSPSRNAISHPYDLELIGKALDKAYQKIQDEWRIGRVHLIVVAPATACVRVGQKMQSGNQGEFVLYERDSDGIFKPTVSINKTHLTHAAGESIEIG